MQFTQKYQEVFDASWDSGQPVTFPLAVSRLRSRCAGGRPR